MHDRENGASRGDDHGVEAVQRSAGKRTRTERLVVQARSKDAPVAAPASGVSMAARGDDPFALHLGAPVQHRGGDASDPEAVHAAAASGIAGGATALPHAAAIQASFGDELDVSGITAHVGGRATEACADMGASAYATGRDIAFAGAPDLHTAAHEAAHVVQQARGVNLYGGVGASGDVYEQHADAVADRVVAGESAASLLRAGPGGAGTAAVQRKESAKGGGDGDAVTDDAVFGGIVKSVTVADTPLIADPAKPKEGEVAKLKTTNQVTPTDLGVGKDFNAGAEGTGKTWWKVKIVKGDNLGKEGWVQVSNLGSILKVTKEGTKETTKVGDGSVEINTGQALERNGANDGDNNFALTYTGKDADNARWLQFIWREIVGVDDKDASTPEKGSITTTGGTYDLTDNGTFAKPGTPAKNNYNTDCPNAADPFYEAVGEADRTADSTKMIDLPGAAVSQVKDSFNKGAKKVVSRAHFTTFLIKGKAVTFQTYIDIVWNFAKKEDAAAPPAGVHTVSGSTTATALPKTIAERFHEQYPAFKDIK